MDKEDGRMRLSEEEWRNKILNKTLREIIYDIEKMAGKEMWSSTFVAKCLLSFEQCLKVEGADYETIDTLTMEIWEKYHLPDVSFITDKNIIGQLGEIIGRKLLNEVD